MQRLKRSSTYPARLAVPKATCLFFASPRALTARRCLRLGASHAFCSIGSLLIGCCSSAQLARPLPFRLVLVGHGASPNPPLPLARPLNFYSHNPDGSQPGASPTNQQVLQHADDNATNGIGGSATESARAKKGAGSASGSDLAGLPPPPDKGCPCVVLRTGFETSQGQLMKTILFATKRVAAGSDWETGVFILILLVFAAVASAFVLAEVGALALAGRGGRKRR